jgi:chemotaxis protein methyltransferase CheR
VEITNENEKIEFDLLLQAIYQKYGYDFRNYAEASLKAPNYHLLIEDNGTLSMSVEEVEKNKGSWWPDYCTVTRNIKSCGHA